MGKYLVQRVSTDSGIVTGVAQPVVATDGNVDKVRAHQRSLIPAGSSDHVQVKAVRR